jgi:Domain of unknown function (DUF5615)
MRLLLDEDSQDKRLRSQLSENGHDVTTVFALDLSGQDDKTILKAANDDHRTLLTRNCDDFIALHRASREHSGILLSHPRQGRPLSHELVVLAVNRIDATFPDLRGLAIPLADWTYDEPV